MPTLLLDPRKTQRAIRQEIQYPLRLPIQAMTRNPLPGQKRRRSSLPVTRRNRKIHPAQTAGRLRPRKRATRARQPAQEPDRSADDYCPLLVIGYGLLNYRKRSKARTLEKF